MHADTTDADLFGDTPEQVVLEFTGTLVDAPSLRTRSDRGRPVPVLCLQLQDVGPLGNAVHAELPFTERERPAYEALVRQLRAGQRVAVTSPARGQRLTLTQAHSVTPVALAAH